MSHVTALGYLGVGARDIDAWEHVATHVLGVQVERAGHTGEDTLFLRIDERHHRIAVRAGNDDVSYVGWEVRSPSALESLSRDLDAAGVPYKEDTALARVRGVHQLITCSDPSGTSLEFFTGALMPKPNFVSPTGARFVTRSPGGNELGFGHIVLAFDDLDAAKTFYLDVLKFRLSDVISPRPELALTFTHVNPRHHSLALIPALDGSGQKLNHFMLEVSNMDEVGRALDKVHADGIRKIATLGRHTNDLMLSFYMHSPSGFGIEYGTDPRLIDDAAWTTGYYDTTSYWGHTRDPES
jgi:3,4-dihydroxy-9,10-secoandrosta-1,3,5(10)-triene-9,17-dione 4,5-dioxygenase